MLVVNILFILFFAVRLFSLKISIQNEKRLIEKQAVQYGKRNSILLSMAHIAFYFSAIYEANSSAYSFDGIAIVGFVILSLAYLALFWVIKALGEIWTVKLYILPEHKINTAFLFQTIRHPNYFLNIIPELIGLGMMCHAWHTLTFIFPAYLVILGVRIYQEETVMKTLFAQARGK
ncbi:Isoprenylcysteine carboxyl methyltransferase [Bibersteinia trehalosi USDA-ARS-USMARC-188]|uniref:Isoprenylcysteine carboxyl methyltransferase n=5 Tax=Bibersteinia trehalosi TaxID=47735 RepID=W0R570_BIBTR|nr:isoprenylcysteine carboxyl methyltransferase family protein [Bibersteinia trehalosi]AGH37615.1 Isoprenylcysteine carboxyl methyltransferase [Bibersteinia trehalosi USDA-ARS-USMARC-192]AHG82576.1 Isoprenylcysteine carboxyl methyltransferase [Bibersteinia trehalosi USDA-ARS-USMARC-188]AHG84910.1 Isoprenylcysteine carboxyl methyltransferase [Bibersteinia trehalosi USDA-ARS-USMARC-189]AHG85607.1 Isoprenylcysteine carboxyl methyltransferase [Bibersteinia trehalosi USDA-ARS-USMARC-190]OAQ13734.1 